MNKLLGKYKNGNYYVSIYEDGTKIRMCENDNFEPIYPESMDLKITNRCNMGCPMCHEDSIKDGKHGDIMNLNFIETLLPYTEIAIGGGNPIEHPDLINFLYKCKSLKLICNMTVNQVHFMENLELLSKLIKEKLIYGIGVSVFHVTEQLINNLKKFPNIVIHIINGVQPLEEIRKLYNLNLKILILGYKQFRKGVEFYSQEVEKLKYDYYKELPIILKNFKIVSFDNLALKQLDPKRFMTQEKWDRFYMGDDGNFTMFIDAVENNYAVSSVSEKRFRIENNIQDMFKKITEK